jgi:hypothetical protein
MPIVDILNKVRPFNRKGEHVNFEFRFNIAIRLFMREEEKTRKSFLIFSTRAI